MNNKAKEFFVAVEADEALKQEALELSKQAQAEVADGVDREVVIEKYTLPFAKKHGYDLTVNDFSLPSEGEMDESELMAVAGGEYCICSGYGGGAGKNLDSEGYFKCGCNMLGLGDGIDEEDDGYNCACPVLGYGGGAGDVIRL